MNEVKKSLKWLGFYFLLLAVNSFIYMERLPYSFLTENITSIYLLILTTCLILRYYLRISGRANLRSTMLTLAAMMFLLILLRCIKYSVFGSSFVLGRYTWYMYYIPMLLLPMLLFFAALYVFAKDEQAIKRRWRPVTVLTLILVVFVLTNDLHQSVFIFKPGFADWDSDYAHGWGFALVTVWQYALYVAAVAVLIAKCAIAKIKRSAWVILIPLAVGIAMVLLLSTGNMPKIGGHNIMGFPEALCFMAAGVMECCIQLGLIPTNESYKGLMKITSLPVQITDLSGKAVYKSASAEALTAEQFALPDNARIGEHTVLKKMSVPGGFGLWQNDVSELDRLSEELEDAKELLSEEAELSRLKNELREKQLKIEQRSEVYDKIANSTQSQSLAISELSKQALETRDAEQRDRCRRHITLLGAYIKRYANLMLLSAGRKTLNVGELGLSVAEVLRYLNFYGIPGELVKTAVGEVPAHGAVAVFEAFDGLIENNLGDLSGVYVNISIPNGDLVFKVALENMLSDSSGKIMEKLSKTGIKTSLETEDNVGYFCFTVPKGGELS